MYVCTSCTVVSLPTTGLKFITSPLTWIAPFDARLMSQTRLSCSQSNGPIIRRRTVALFFDLDCNSQILVYRSQGWSNLTFVHHCVELRFSNAQCCQALKRRSRFHSLSHQSHRAFLGDWVARKVLSTKTDHLNKVSVFDKCRTARFNGTTSNSRGSLILWAKCFAVLARSNQSWAKCGSLMQADLHMVASSLFKIRLCLPSNTGLSCSFSRGVLTALVFVLHLDSLMMSGACLKSSSMSRYCPV